MNKLISLRIVSWFWYRTESVQLAHWSECFCPKASDSIAFHFWLSSRKFLRLQRVWFIRFRSSDPLAGLRRFDSSPGDSESLLSPTSDSEVLIRKLRIKFESETVLKHSQSEFLTRGDLFFEFERSTLRLSDWATLFPSDIARELVKAGCYTHCMDEILMMRSVSRKVAWLQVGSLHCRLCNDLQKRKTILSEQFSLEPV